MLLAGVACSDNDEQCSTLPSQVFSVTVFDNDAPSAGIQSLVVERNGNGLGDLTVRVTPWAGENAFRFPYRLHPIIANQAGATVTVTAYDENFEVLTSGTSTLPWRDDGTECVVSATADGVVEIELD